VEEKNDEKAKAILDQFSYRFKLIDEVNSLAF
jgi:hypothetical protein